MRWIIYFISITDEFKLFNKFFAIMIGIYLGIILVLFISGNAALALNKYDEENRDARTLINWIKNQSEWIKGGIVIFIFTLSLNILMPSSKSMVAIWLVPKIANNEEVQQLPINTMEFLNKKLEQWAKDIEGTNDK